MTGPKTLKPMEDDQIMTDLMKAVYYWNLLFLKHTLSELRRKTGETTIFKIQIQIQILLILKHQLIRSNFS